jgi:hypothetical protein
MNKNSLMLLALLLIPISSVNAWWDYDWVKQKQLVITSNDSVYAWNDSMEINVTGLTLNTNSCLKEPRIVNETNNATLNYTVVNAGGENETAGNQWCVLRIEDVIVLQDQNLTDLRVYYANPNATNPSYSAVDEIVQGTNLLSNGGFETGDLTGWSERADRYNHGNVKFEINTTQANSGTYSVWTYSTNLGSDSLYQCVDFYPQYEYNISVAVYTIDAESLTQEALVMAFFDLQNSTASKDFDDVFASFGIGDANWQDGGGGIFYGYGSYDNWIIGRVNRTSETHAYSPDYQTFYIEAEQNDVWNWTQWNLTDVVANNLTMSFNKTLDDVLYICAGYKEACGSSNPEAIGHVDDFAIIPMGTQPVVSFESETTLKYCGDAVCAEDEDCNSCEADCACSGSNFCDWSASQGAFTCQGTYTNVGEETRGFLIELLPYAMVLVVVLSIITMFGYVIASYIRSAGGRK